MFFRSLIASAVAAALLLACSSKHEGPVYASCSDVLPTAILTRAGAGVPPQVELLAGKFYWVDGGRVGDLYAAATLVAYAPGGQPKPVLTHADGIGQFWIEGTDVLFIGGTGGPDRALWRAPLDGTKPPAQVLTFTTQASWWMKDATTLYGVSDSLVAPTTPPQTSSTLAVVAQPLDGTAPRPLATWTVPTAGIGEDRLYDDGDTLVGFGAGSIFRVAKGDGRVVAQQPMIPKVSIVLTSPPRDGTFFAGTGDWPRLATFGLDGTVTDLWSDDLPAFRPYALTTASDGTAYVAGVAPSSATADYPALAVLRPGVRPSIALCTPDDAATRVLVGDDGVYLVRSNASGWWIVRVPR
jgi:hypothetical protein